MPSMPRDLNALFFGASPRPSLHERSPEMAFSNAGGSPDSVGRLRRTMLEAVARSVGDGRIEAEVAAAAVRSLSQATPKRLDAIYLQALSADRGLGEGVVAAAST